MGVNGLTAGDTFTVEQLLVGLLVPSGSDAANALARHVGMSLADTDDPESGFNAFVDEMNNYVLSIGLKNTRFTNPSGDDSDNSYSSAHDLARLGGRLMRDQTLRAIVNQPAMSLTSIGPEQRPYEEPGTNQLLGQRGVVGIKTGSTPEAGACLIGARSVNDGRNTVITVVLGSDLAYDANDIITTDGRWGDTEAIFNAMDDTFRWVAPAAEGVFPGLDEQMSVWGVSMQEPPAIPVPNDPTYAIRYQLVLVPPDGEKATGRVLLYYGEDEVGFLPVYPTETAQTQAAA
jgi:D-alanyl-D-alanine carboxypeptidase